MPDPVPHDIRQLADERARARRARDWVTADRIKAELEAAGWKVVDAGTLYSLERLPEGMIEVNGEVRYGTSDAVPSLLDTPVSAPASVVLVAADEAGLVARTVASIRAGSPDAEVVVVANGPSDVVAAEVAALDGVEVVALASRLGAAAARNAGIRRAAGEIVVLLDLRVVLDGDLAGAMAQALGAPEVAVAGLRGLTTTDLVRFEPIHPDRDEPAAVDSLAIAFRRVDYVERGPLDEHFTALDYLDAWWSLVLRDVGEDAVFGVDVPRSAAVVAMPFALQGEAAPATDERLARKQRYRFLKAFAARRDLIPSGG